MFKCEKKVIMSFPPGMESSFRAGLKRFCDEVVLYLWPPAPFPCLQTSRSFNEEHDMSAAIQDITVNL